MLQMSVRAMNRERNLGLGLQVVGVVILGWSEGIVLRGSHTAPVAEESLM